MEISVGHTPDSDDAFMFYGMFTGKVPSPDFEVQHVIEDIEKLNRKATNPELDVTAVSVHACAYIPGYTILRSGGSFGIGYGPIVTAKKPMTIDEIKKCKIAIPGKMTSAFLLLQLMIGKFDYVEMNFSDIPQAVKNGDVDAGLVIHETQLSYEQEGNVKILDVGEWWDKTTNGLPVPLGINVMKTSLGMDTIHKFDKYLQASIEYALENLDDAIDYAMQYSRGKPRDLIEKFVKMYVNPVTVNMEDKGEESIRRVFEMAKEKGLVPDFNLSIAIK
ncbi:MAG: ABC transporter substrate-binding protein [Nitrosopumilaceae archaeon]|uniref:ABC transporter substrate-binding protein n=3 Tax=Candidatus Nitrosomaritimum aestuariumsis TaxID=3342354 RepID=A0AC60W3R5_9ARCH|nr:ABC transporter substrate-binding protein [Nitrosopumilaceae archaeon]MBA4454261.1 ABC transporter substrate-binding protein [Nitrosopumilaceae archaeon]MBA4459466.1 ABC transporter substrate-binding protein [Nitrosopumilaceae archaeon]MBA4462492.1 ABC transporter substrate-binding protein [Nitrosopumilaceae archaeon]MBA4463484.1 ABC transporter substrate-binding protein [Nitrosopumilaceae archaeon]